MGQGPLAEEGGEGGVGKCRLEVACASFKVAAQAEQPQVKQAVTLLRSLLACVVVEVGWGGRGTRREHSGGGVVAYQTHGTAMRCGLRTCATAG